MKRIQINERVQVLHDIPELELRGGDVGVVCSKWFKPTTAYEVEFQRGSPLCCVRALLMPNQLRLLTTLAISVIAGH